MVAIILAAGFSTRMGRPKAMLDVLGTTFVRRLVSELSRTGLTRIIIVIGSDGDAIVRETEAMDVDIVRNPEPSRGQLSSLLAGLEAAERYRPDGVLVHLVDRPMVGRKTVDLLLRSFADAPTRMVVPTFHGMRGHPVIFPERFFEALKRSPPDVGARHVLWSNPHDVLDVEVTESGIIDNIDTRDDYARLICEIIGVRQSSPFSTTNHTHL